MKIKNLKASELATKKPADIENHIAELKSSLEKLLHEIHTGKENKTHQINVIKKAIARAKTVQTAIAREEK